MNIPFFVTGFSSVLLQIVCIRKLLTVFSGNEMVIGMTLAIWLVAVGAGSYLGAKFRKPGAFAISFLIISVLGQLTVLLLDQAELLLKTSPGETVSLPLTFGFTLASLFPLCFTIGTQFPLSVRYAGGEISRVYGLEAAGSFAGGILFTFFLSGRFEPAFITFSAAMVNMAVAALVSKRVSLLLLLAVPPFIYAGASIYPGLTSSDTGVSGLRHLETLQSRYGEIKVNELGGQYNVFVSGKFVFSYPDRQTEEPAAHLPLSLHERPLRVLVVGGSLSMLREYLKYPLVSIDYLEIDPMLIKVSEALVRKSEPGLLNGGRVHIHAEDARGFIKSRGTPGYDLIVLNLPEPSTAWINRYYTTEFFREAANILKDEGIISLSLPSSFGYIGRKMQAANGAIYNSLRSVFGHVEVSSEEYGFMFASDRPIDTSPDLLEKRFSGRGIKTDYFHPSLFQDAFSSHKTAMVKDRLSASGPLNSDLRPIAYLHNLRLWSGLHGGRLMDLLLSVSAWTAAVVSALALLAIIILFRRNKAPVYYSLFSTGYVTMSFSVIVIMGYQARFGYAYEMIGLLTAVFMAGLAIGAYSGRDSSSPLRRLREFELFFVLLSGAALMSVRSELLYFMLNFCCGLLGGLVFSTVPNCFGRDAVEGTAGRLYALEMSGSFAGALLTGIFTVPVAGVRNSLILLMVVKSVSFMLLRGIETEVT
ncbi:MAG: hypothetical protein HZB33_02350 [Nitrospirae bacterium]|nr:hypothetical protein [Nitrospirota bacterium]